MEKDILNGAIEIVKILIKNGFEAVFVGGYVRDMILNIKSNDIDIATSALPKNIEQIFDKTISIGKQFGVMLVLNKGYKYEVASFRNDDNKSDGRHPYTIHFTSMENDALRRDFTINGMFYNPITKTIYDFVGGKEDIKNKIVRFIGEPYKRIIEDKLRMIRAIRIAAKLDFMIETNTFIKIKDNAELINNVSSERLYDEFNKILLGKNVYNALLLLYNTHLLNKIIPEIENSKIDHIFKSIAFITKKTRDLSIIWATLLYNVNRNKTVIFKIEGHIKYVKSNVKLDIINKIMRRFNAPNIVRNNINNILNDYQHIETLRIMPRYKFRKYIAKPYFKDLIKMYESLSIQHVNDNLTYLKNILNNKELLILPNPLITGKDLINLNIYPHINFKTILENINNMYLNGDINTKDEAIDEIKKMV